MKHSPLGKRGGIITQNRLIVSSTRDGRTPGSPLAAEHSLGSLEFHLGFLHSNTWGAAAGASGKDEGEPAIMDVDPDAWFRDTISPRRAFLSSTCASTVRCRHLARPQRLRRKSRPRNHERTSWRAPSADPADADPGSLVDGSAGLPRAGHTLGGPPGPLVHGDDG